MESPVFLLQRLLAWLRPQHRKSAVRDQEAAAEVVRRLRELRDAGTLTSVGGPARKARNPVAKERIGDEKNGTWH